MAHFHQIKLMLDQIMREGSCSCLLFRNPMLSIECNRVSFTVSELTLLLLLVIYIEPLSRFIRFFPTFPLYDTFL